ncbi:helix-turn-helix transcriptional regulator [Nocardiopsis sp. NPDC058789]|uniref:helix-turn-helix transcriptional regulator n=1 Tax=Nocardiopsis sp. NPDC058789 TaxID=3346634 RepID=UPI00366CF5F6
MNDEPTPAMTYGERVKARRATLDLTQSELARMTGLSRGTIRNLETDAVETTKLTRQLIDEALAQAEGKGAPTERLRKTTSGSLPASTGKPTFSERRVRESIASQIELMAAAYPEDVFPEGGESPEARSVDAMRHAYRTAARIARGEDQ